MKIKKIRKLWIGDTLFDIIWDNKTDGGCFNLATSTIEIGCNVMKEQPAATLSVIIHELKEIIQVFQHTRYTRPDEERAFEFHYTHKEHSDLCYRLAGLLTQFIK